MAFRDNNWFWYAETASNAHERALNEGIVCGEGPERTREASERESWVQRRVQAHTGRLRMMKTQSGMAAGSRRA